MHRHPITLFLRYALDRIQFDGQNMGEEYRDETFDAAVGTFQAALDNLENIQVKFSAK